MQTFATVESLQAGWRTLNTSETATAMILLKRATAYLIALMDRKGAAIDVADEIQLINLETVTCNMVRRVMDAPVGGTSSISQGIGATNASVAFINPDASLYLTKSDMVLLGIAKSATFWTIPAHTYADDVGCGQHG